MADKKSAAARKKETPSKHEGKKTAAPAPAPKKAAKPAAPAKTIKAKGLEGEAPAAKVKRGGAEYQMEFKRGVATGALKMPGMPLSASFFATGCGAESVPRK